MVDEGKDAGQTILVVTIDGKKYSVDDLTIDELAALEAELEIPWSFINPVSQATHYRAVVRTVLARTIGEEQARKQVGAMSGGDAVATISFEKDNLPTVFEDGIPDDPKD